jgi:hypothetical protein
MWTSVSDPVTGYDHKVRKVLLRSVKRFDEVPVIHLGTDMEIADLSERTVFELARDAPNGQQRMSELKSMRFDAPRVESKNGSA